MSMTVELPSDDVGVTVNECIESNSPIIQVTFRRNVADQIYLLSYFFRLAQLAFNPLEHVTRIGWILEKEPVLVVTSLGVH